MDNKKNTIAEKMKYLRKINNMTQDDLATATGIYASLIRKYETNDRNPKYEQLQLIASALGVKPSFFYDEEISTVGDVITLVDRLKKQTKCTITGEKDENGNYIPSTITLSFKDATLNKSLAQYVAYEELMKNRTDNDYTLDSENKKMRLLMDQTQIKKPHK